MTRITDETASYIVRGWCPTAMRPMATGDGLIVRLDTSRRTLSPTELSAIADIAERYGNGLIDLTRRANIQLRGVRDDTLPHVWRDLDRLGLLDRDASAPRNILIGPLAGFDASEVIDPRQVADRLAVAIADATELRMLPGKFSFLVDAAGIVSLDDEPADIRLRAVLRDGHPMMAIGIDGDGGVRWLPAGSPDEAPDRAIALAKAFLRLRSAEPRRMRDLDEPTATAMIVSAGESIASVATIAHRPNVSRLALGSLNTAGVTAACVAAPFGRIAAAPLRRFGAALAGLDVTTVRVTPWRSLCVMTGNAAASMAVIEAAAREEFLTEPDDPLLDIDACPGAPACSGSSVDTRAAAVALAPRLRELGVTSCHVSGCSKGCARSTQADLTLVGTNGSFAVVRRGTARSVPSHVVAVHDIATSQRLLEPI